MGFSGFIDSPMTNPNLNSIPPKVYIPKVYIIGAGPGDRDLLTVKADRLLRQADLILYTDSLIPPEILEFVPSTAQIIPAANKNLDELLEILITAARSGLTTIRLHDGDPSLYGAIQEQMQGLLHAGVDFEIIPGISAYQLAAAKLRVELTVPQRVQTIILTRISGRTHVPESQDLATLAAAQASLCLYLSAKHLDRAQAQLLEHYPSETPVALCYHLGWPDERIVLTPLKMLAETNAREGLIRSTLYLISPALTASTIPDQYSYPDRHQSQPEHASRLYDRTHSRWLKP
jgi:precorrin-4/cobalt-precorrin-4 C11-methyltransferase